MRSPSHSLRIKLLLAVGLVVVISVAAVGYLSSRITTTEFHRFQRLVNVEEGEPSVPDGMADRLVEHFEKTGSWTGVEETLSTLTDDGRDQRMAFIVLDRDGNFAASSIPGLADATVTPVPGGGLRLSASGRGPDGASELELFFMTEGPALHDSTGALIGTVYPLPGLPSTERSPADRFLVLVNRSLILAVAGAGLVALMATYLLARRIVSPIEALTRAARKMERGDLGQRVAVLHNNDEIGQLSAAFNAMADGLERTERLRRQMVSDVAHELRTPLTGIRCQLESIQDGVIEPSADVIASLRDDLLSLQRLVDDLQDLAVVEAGSINLERRPVNLDDEVTVVVRSLISATKKKGAAPVQPDVRISLRGLPAADVDPRRFRQIIRNLLTNALTHTPSGGTIEISGRSQNGRIEIIVKDDGPGIPPEHLPNIFERFYRADPSRQRKTGGAGLGLAIVKQLVEVHGGEIRADSGPGRGATFLFTLPEAASESTHYSEEDATPGDR
ncbi:MAG: ATP-binding protein [Acidobacteria bacterium]|nr:ATP-binding protein [Acidobacteriota bacterium]